MDGMFTDGGRLFVREGKHRTEADSRQGGYNWTWMKLPTRCLLRISLSWGTGVQTGVWLEPQGQLLSRGLRDTKTHWSASDTKLPHIHLRKKIHLENNAHSHYGHHIWHCNSVWGTYTGYHSCKGAFTLNLLGSVQSKAALEVLNKFLCFLNQTIFLLILTGTENHTTCSVRV